MSLESTGLNLLKLKMQTDAMMLDAKHRPNTSACIVLWFCALDALPVFRKGRFDEVMHKSVKLTV